MPVNIDVKSSTLEKITDKAFDFLNILIKPAVQETGLLIKDQVQYWRFKKQVKLLKNAEEYCKKHNIRTRTIPIKILEPLLNKAGLEEDEYLDEKWAILLGNLADTEQNLQNHIFPYLLSQLSKSEFLTLETIYAEKQKKRSKILRKREAWDAQNKEELIELEKTLSIEDSRLPDLLTIIDLYNKKQFKSGTELERERYRDLSKKRHELSIGLHAQEYIGYGVLELYEVQNLVRLGLLKTQYNLRGHTEEGSIGKKNDYDGSYDLRELDVTIESDSEDYYISNLGEKFMEVCSEKSRNHNT